MPSIEMLLPDGMGIGVAALLVAASFFTSALTAAFGVGGGMAMITLMGLFVPVSALIPVHGAVQLGSNTGRAWYQRAHVRTDVAWPFIAGSFVGAIIGVFIVVQLPDAVLKIVLALFILFTTWFTIPGMQRLSRIGLAAASVGIAIISMLVGATGALVSALFAQYFAGDRKALVATHAATMTVQHALKIVVFAIAGFSFRAWLPLIAAMIATGYAGTLWGSALLERLPEETFRHWFKVGLTLLALDLLRRGVFP